MPRTTPPSILPDPRNADLRVWVDGEIVPRAEARVSVFDSVVQGGDAVWEGVRVYNGRVFALEEHLARLFTSAHALAFSGVPTADEVRHAIFATLQANGMRDRAHMRVTLTRGRKVTSGMDPRNNQEGCTLIVLAEWKPLADTRGRPVAEGPGAAAGISLVTSEIRRNPPQCLDSRIHHNNLLNNILAKIEANDAGADDALMLDMEGFIAETNATNVFLVRGGEVLTPIADACLPGITRAKVLELCRMHGVPHAEKRLTLTDAWTADEMFVTGTLGELTPVGVLDGRVIGGLSGVAGGAGRGAGPVTRKLQALYAEMTAREGVLIPS
ncbi:MAG: aminotransferase class IV [Planctomycetota bacterium]|nr:aminotransferase class IV [Planctomycetota bacterium]MDA1105337.1 aminotransferase class IV [Planctomycetota bacterium]